MSKNLNKGINRLKHHYLYEFLKYLHVIIIRFVVECCSCSCYAFRSFKDSNRISDSKASVDYSIYLSNSATTFETTSKNRSSLPIRR